MDVRFAPGEEGKISCLRGASAKSLHSGWIERVLRDAMPRVRKIPFCLGESSAEFSLHGVEKTGEWLVLHSSQAWNEATRQSTQLSGKATGLQPSQ
jgi:hypothetical protein